MSASASAAWLEANQRGLVAAVARVGEWLDRQAGADAGEPESAAPPPAMALDVLCAAFDLSPFEREVLVLCAAMDLDSSFGARCAAAQGDPRRSHPTFGLALAALPRAHWSALGPGAALRRYKLVEVETGEVLTQAPLRIDERVLHYLTGVSYLDERLQGLLQAVPPAGALAASHEAIASRIEAVWTAAAREPARPWPVVQLVGASGPAKRDVAALACARMGLGLHAVRAADLPAGAVEQDAIWRLWAREGVLARSALLLDADEMETAERARVVLALERAAGPVLVAAHEPIGDLRRLDVRLEVGRPSSAEQRAGWNDRLGSWSDRLQVQVDALCGQFSLDLASIGSVCASALAGAGPAEPAEGLGARLWDGCRAQARSRLDELAQRIAPQAGFDDLVLPDAQKELLRQIANQVRSRPRVYEDWGFGPAGTRGLGITALFSGASGTGKTMAADVLAGELRLDLYRIDLSQVVSKYIGETEKNLRRVFDAAEGGGAILLFDEADALFGKRSEVKDSHDRYANVEVSYLLQRMEAYRGLAILTTNMKNALDPAFLRRLRFVVGFPFPDVRERAEIWRRVFPRDTPTEGLDVAMLARLGVAGGNIRNIALHAAFLAADSDGPVRMPHILRAARGEYAKLERTLTESEIGGWA